MEKDLGTNFNAELVAKDPGLRKIYLGKAPEVYENLLKNCRINPTDIDRNKRRLEETIRRPKLPQTAVKNIFRVVFNAI